jgi:hypothetical protein
MAASASVKTNAQPRWGVKGAATWIGVRRLSRYRRGQRFCFFLRALTVCFGMESFDMGSPAFAGQPAWWAVLSVGHLK